MITRRELFKMAGCSVLGAAVLGVVGCGGSTKYTSNDAVDKALAQFYGANPNASSKGQVSAMVRYYESRKEYTVIIDWVYFGRDTHFEKRFIYVVSAKTGECHRATISSDPMVVR